MANGYDRTFQKAQWAFPLVLTLHNLEEGLWLPGFWQTRGQSVPVSALEFRLALVLVALLGYVVTYWSVRAGQKSVGAYTMAAFWLLLMLNAVWHIAATAYMHTYAPGVVTAVFLNLPVTIYLLGQALRLKYI